MSSPPQKPCPPGWPRISSSLYYVDARKAIDWLCKAFGFEIQLKVEGEGGRIEHSELRYGEGLLMVGSADNSEKLPLRRSRSRTAVLGKSCAPAKCQQR